MDIRIINTNKEPENNRKHCILKEQSFRSRRYKKEPPPLSGGSCVVDTILDCKTWQ